MQILHTDLIYICSQTKCLNLRRGRRWKIGRTYFMVNVPSTKIWACASKKLAQWIVESVQFLHNFNCDIQNFIKINQNTKNHTTVMLEPIFLDGCDQTVYFLCMLSQGMRKLCSFLACFSSKLVTIAYFWTYWNIDIYSKLCTCTESCMAVKIFNCK